VPLDDTAAVQATFCATVIDQWVRDGVAHAVVAPGSRSTPMALALASRPELAVHVVHDERTASFAGLGIGLATGVPAIVLCTSGTAAAHLHAAVVEAHLSGVPMLVLTADRPPELRDVGAPQTIDQTRLYGPAVRWFHDPGVPERGASGSWRSLARRAHEASVGVDPGPVHLNLPFREPLVGEVGDVPAPLLGPLLGREANTRLGTTVMALERDRGVIVAGRGVDDPDAVAALGDATGWPVLADPRSGCRGRSGVVTAFDAVLRHAGFADGHVPDVVLHLGEPPASKVLAQWLAGSRAVQVRVTSRPAVVDPAHAVTHRVVAPVAATCRRLAGELRGASDGAWRERWLAADAAAEAAMAPLLSGDAGATEPAVARALTTVAGELVVASSMPVRDVEWFGTPHQRATVRSNRGANGIDGTIATATGVALGTRRPVTVLLGDVALVHDASSLTALARRDVDVRVVVLDNDGGGIFSFLPQATQLPAERFEQLFGTPHGTDLVGLAAAHGIPAQTVGTPNELLLALTRPGHQLLRIETDRAANVALHRRLHDAAVAAVDGLPR